MRIVVAFAETARPKVCDLEHAPASALAITPAVSHDQKVIGLDVSMDDAALVQIGEHGEQLREDAAPLRLGERTAPLDPLEKVLAAHELDVILDEAGVEHALDARVAAAAKQDALPRVVGCDEGGAKFIRFGINLVVSSSRGKEGRVQQEAELYSFLSSSLLS